MATNEPHKKADHSGLEDALAFLTGAFCISLSIQFLTQASLITGQTAGLAALIDQLTGLTFGRAFFLINLPFYIFAYMRMGLRFTLKTLIAVTIVSVAADALPLVFQIGTVHPVYASVAAGILAGLGLIIFFRHGASLGGVGVVALWSQEKLGIQAGWVQLGFDIALFAVALVLLDAPLLVAYSLVGAFIVNMIIAVNHRQDRYIGR